MKFKLPNPFKREPDFFEVMAASRERESRFIANMYADEKPEQQQQAKGYKKPPAK